MDVFLNIFKIFRTAAFIQHLWMVASWFTHVGCRVNVGQECQVCRIIEYKIKKILGILFRIPQNST